MPARVPLRHVNTPSVSYGLYRIDPRQNKIVAVIRVGAAPTSLAASPQGVWVGVT